MRCIEALIPWTNTSEFFPTGVWEKDIIQVEMAKQSITGFWCCPQKQQHFMSQNDLFNSDGGQIPANLSASTSSQTSQETIRWRGRQLNFADLQKQQPGHCSPCWLMYMKMGRRRRHRKKDRWVLVPIITTLAWKARNDPNMASFANPIEVLNSKELHWLDMIDVLTFWGGELEKSWWNVKTQ